MLDQATKQKIDSARDILVGKVPDPKAQVEQITTALIYKFMDDMDKESEELGGEAKFFANGFSQYSWTKLLDNKLSGQERLDLYVQAIANMSKNPHIPQLFRDIFKGAFLPYNDPRTLSLFLKEINEFNYEHSENLGNAFEYLLSILGSQGKAGQFRTPRHIIDFIVEVIDPKKNETILDPACGTAGFLISAYKHILKQNKELPAETSMQTRKTLTPDEKLRLMNNFVGYDISPDMVKLALVNMYLHGFPEPKIYEYDTLSNEKRWDETFDVIMANPPFMTPKGGINPHKRFSIQANRAEVLFVDYIMEHLNIKGRAGIIVPEGIIFQSNKAYTQLRKKLVEDGLLAVVSLPSGVFQPYSGVKTSILIFDKEIAKQAKEILFVKIENDGFDLGAQRRAIDKNDLPQALSVIKKFQKTQGDKDFTKEEKEISLLVERSEIAESGDYNLTGERYRESEIQINQKWPMVELGEVFLEIKNGKNVKQFDEVGKFKVSRIQTIANGEIDLLKTKYTNDNILENDFLKEGDILFSHINSIEHLAKTALFINIQEKIVHGANLIRLRPNKEKLIPKYALSIFKTKNFIENARRYAQKAVNQASINTTVIKNLKIPLPPLSVQKEIVEQIEVKQKAIDSAKEVIKNLERERAYFGQSLRKLEGVEFVEIGELCEIMTGGTPTSTVSDYYENGNIKWLVSGDIHKGEILDCDKRITELGMEKSNARILPKNSVLIALNGQGKTRGTVALLRTEATCNQSLVAMIPKDERSLIAEFLYIALRSMYQEIRNITGDTQRRGLNMIIIRKIKIPLPPLEIQKQLVAQAEKEQEIIEANKRLIEIMEGKIEEVLREI